MARLLGEARVAVVGMMNKAQVETDVKKATEGIKGKVKLDLDTKGMDAQIAAQQAAIMASQSRIAKARDADAKTAERQIANQTKMWSSMFDQIGKSEAQQAAKEAAMARARAAAQSAEQASQNRIAKAREADAKTAQRDITNRKNLYANLFDQISKSETQQAAQEAAMDKARTAAASRQQVSQDRITKARHADILTQQKGIADTQAMYSKMFDDLNKRDKVKVNVDGSLAEANAVSIREKLKATLSDIKVKVKATRDNLSFDGVLNFIRGKFSKDIEGSGGDAGSKFGGGFMSGLAKSALMQNPGITAAVIAGLAALPAAVGAVGVLGGIALGAGIVFGAEKLVKSQIKSITADMKTLQTAMGGTPTSTTSLASQQLSIQTTKATIARLSNLKKPTAAQSQQLSTATARLGIQQQGLATAQSKGQGTTAQQQQLAQDKAQLAQYNKYVVAFKTLDNAVTNLKLSFLSFAVVASKPLIKPFADAINGLAAQLKGPLAAAFFLLFKAVAPLVKPVVDSFVLLIKGVLPGLTEMLKKARGPLSDLFLNFGKIVGLKIGDWFKEAIPYIKDSATYFLDLVKALGSIITFLIKFGGESAKAFGGSQFKGFGKLLEDIANDLLKLIIPAFEGWTAVMAPLARDLLLIVAPLIHLLAVNPTLVKTLTALAAAWFLVSKAVTVTAIAMKILGFSSATILAVAPWIALAAAVVIAVVLIIKYWKPISGFFVKIWKDIWSGFIGPFINFFMNTVPHAFGITINWIEKHWPLLVSIIGGPIAAIAILITKRWGAIFNFLKGIWGHILNAATGIFKPIASVVEGVWNKIYTITRDTWGVIWKVIRIPILIILGLVGELVIGVRNAFNAVWPWVYHFTKDIWGHIENVITGVVKPIVSVVVGAWNAIKGATIAVWNWIFNFTKASWGHLENVITGIVKPIVSVIVGAWNTVKSATVAAWNWIGNISRSVWGHIENVITGIVKPIVSVITGSWNVVKSATEAAFNVIYTHIVTPLQKAWDWIGHSLVPGIESAFKGLVSVVTTIWDGLKSAVGTPINFVINDIWNPFAGFVNKGLSIFGIKEKLSLGKPVTFATGGHVPGYSPGKDTVPAMLSPGEFVINPVSARAIGIDNLHAMNSMKFASGGGVPAHGSNHTPGATNPFGPSDIPKLNAKTKAHTGGGIPIIGPIVNLGKDILAKGAAWAVQHMLDPLIEQIAGASGSGNIIGEFLPAIMKKVENGILAWVGIHGQQAPGTGPAGGATGSEMANGLELYQYLLANLFGGSKIAAAGATASIWGESTWNPFAQGTGGRGLIGWTPPGTISDAAFKGGMRTQEPEIINFVSKNGDMGAIRQMEGASSVLEAANIWGKQVERYGINDVHSTGIALATQFMNSASPLSQKAATPKGTKAARLAAAHKTHFATGGEVLAFGASASAGYGASAGHTYEDDLARVLRGYTVKNAGIVGNDISRDNSSGAAGVKRFRSLLDANTKAAVIWEGNDDIGAGVGASAIERAYSTIIRQAHASGVKVVGGTLQPVGWAAGTKSEDTRRAVNSWIRGKHGFDEVADFDAALRNPRNPSRMADWVYDKGEVHGPHPGNPGYAAVADVAHAALSKVLRIKALPAPVAHGKGQHGANVSSLTGPVRNTAYSKRHDADATAYHHLMHLAKTAKTADARAAAKAAAAIKANDINSIDRLLNDPVGRLALTFGQVESPAWKYLSSQLRYHSTNPTAVSTKYGRLSAKQVKAMALNATPDVLDAIYAGPSAIPQLAGSLKGSYTNYAGQNPSAALKLLGLLTGQHGIYSGTKFRLGGLLPAGPGYGVAGGVPFSFNEGGNREKIVPGHVQIPGEQGMTASQAERLIAAVERNTTATVAGDRETNKHLGNTGHGIF